MPVRKRHGLLKETRQQLMQSPDKFLAYKQAQRPDQQKSEFEIVASLLHGSKDGQFIVEASRRYLSPKQSADKIDVAQPK